MKLKPLRLARPSLITRSTGAAGDAARDFLNDVSKQADAVKDTVSKQADTVKQSAAAAVEDVKSQTLKLANSAVSNIDSLVADVSSNVAAVKRDAGSSSKAAGLAIDSMVTRAIEKGQAVKETLAAGRPDVEAQIDAVLSRFVARANEVRNQLNSQAWGPSKALDEAVAAVTAFGVEIRDLVVKVSAGATGLSADDLSKQLPQLQTAGSAASSSSSGEGFAVLPWLQLWATLASLYYTDMAIKGVLTQYAIKFPSALVGMFGVFGLLCAVGDNMANKILAFYGPALNWIARWLPIFYVPALVTLPLALQGIPGADLLRILGILSAGMVATLMFTAQITVAIREAVKTPVKEIAKAKPSPPFMSLHYIAWGTIFAASLVAIAVGGPQMAAQAALPFGLAVTLGGFLIGELVPKAYHGILHPVLVTAVVANAGLALQGKLLGISYNAAQTAYLAKGAGPMGGGDALMSLLGLVIISFGFRVYTQRETMKRHFPEIVGATILSSIFSLFSTAFAAKAIGLSAGLARALVPRSVTVALALPIAQGLEAPLAITAAAVLLQGILGANFGPGLMTRFGVKDTIARGLAAAGTAGGLGTASLTSKEPEALPFCALSYALVGIFSTVIMSVPAVRDIVIGIVG